MRNRSTDLRLNQTRKVMQRTKENGTKSEKHLRVQVIKRMQFHLRSSRHQIEDRDINLRRRIRMQAGNL